MNTAYKQPLITGAILLAVAVAYFLFPVVTAAHGGVKQVAGDAVVTNIQSPLSPLANEEVRFSYVFATLSGIQLEGKEINLRIIESYTGSTVLTKQLNTDENGLANISHSFANAGAYDAELSFTDASGMPQTVGFMVQVRSLPERSLPWLHYGLAAVAGAAIPTALLVRSTSNKPAAPSKKHSK